METSPEKIQPYLTYKRLYSQPQVNNNNQMEAFLSKINLPKITEEQNGKLIKEITEEEIQWAIRKMKRGEISRDRWFPRRMVKNNKRAINSNFLKHIQMDFEKQKYSRGFSTIPKAGKDQTECGNYHQVSLLNNYYKWFTSTKSRRIEALLQN